MPDIVSTDVAYTPTAQGQRTVFRTAPREKRVFVKVVFGDAALTYPAGGIPLTAIASDVDLQRNIRRWEIVDGDDGSGITWKVDHENLKLRGYRQGVRSGSTAQADSVLGALLEDSEAAETIMRAMDVTVDTDVDLGSLRELTSGANPIAQQTLFMYAYGW